MKAWTKVELARSWAATVTPEEGDNAGRFDRADDAVVAYAGDCRSSSVRVPGRDAHRALVLHAQGCEKMNSSPGPTALSSELITAYQQDGAVCVRGLFSAGEIALLESGIEENLRQPSSRAKVASRPDDPGRFFEDFCNWQTNDAYRRFIFESKVGEVTAQLMQSKQVRLYHDHLLVKEPGTQQATPWHQDQPYYNIEGRQNVSMWLPVDPVSREATLQFVAGSHRGNWLMPRTFMDNKAKWFEEGTLEELPDIDTRRDDYRILAWQLEPGDAVFFHMLTLHASAGVSGSNRRRAFSVRFLGDDVTHAPRRWKTSPDFPGLANELAAGAPMEHPLFPLLTHNE